MGPNLISHNLLGNHNFPVVDISLSSLEAVDILIQETYDEITVEETAALQDFVRQGKGLITAGLAWWWAYENQNVADKYPGNQMLRGTGLTIAGDWGVPVSIKWLMSRRYRKCHSRLNRNTRTPPKRFSHSRTSGYRCSNCRTRGGTLIFSFENFFCER